MLKQRNKVFETNSSSTHCITVSDRKDWKYDLPITVNPIGTESLVGNGKLGAV